MATITGLLMTTSFISLTSFGALSGQIAASYHLPPTTVTVMGVDAFSVGLFVAFFLGNGGIFDNRLKLGVLISQGFLIIPQFIIPIFYSLDALVVLRFFQGMVIMMLALFSIQLSGWFREDERGIALAFTLGAITLGSAAGGFLPGLLSSVSWQEGYYITGGLMIVGAMVYFIFARDAQPRIELKKKINHINPWSNRMTWIMGAIQLPLTWTLFSVGGYLASFTEHLGYPAGLASDLIVAWGLSGFIAAFIGALMGDRLTHGKRSNREVLNARLLVMTIADALMGIGALLMLLFGGISYEWLMLGAVINGFLMMLPPNYWALPATVFPAYLVGAGAFGMGLISNSADAIGPIVSSLFTNDWSLVFGIIVAISFMGALGNMVIMKSKLNVLDQPVNA